MNRILNISIKALCALLMVASVGCSDDEDKDRTAPFGNVQTPVSGREFIRGQSIILNASFTDDRELSHVVVTVYALKGTRGIDTPWSATETIELKGKEQTLASYELFGNVIPSDIMSGSYFLDFLIVDKAQNNMKLVVPIVIE